MASKFYSEFHYKQTHIKFQADLKVGLEAAKTAVVHSRSVLEQYIREHPGFVTALDPVELDFNAPELVRDMMKAGLLAGVGPMAAVAGGLSEVATEAMLKQNCKLALAENGGDISIKGSRPFTIGVYAGENQDAKKVGFKIKPTDLPLGVCTSAGQIGHSISFGATDAVIVFSRSAFLSDAAATAVANIVKPDDPEGAIQNGLEKAESIEGVLGCIIFIGDLAGSTGKIPQMVEVLDSDL